jgi:hypothetical protein
VTARAALLGVSAAQLAAGLTGLGVALRRRRNYDAWMPPRLDLPLWHGSPDHVARDSVLMGTAYSAPVPMLVAQLGSTVRLARRGDRRSVRDLTVLGAMMTGGYLVERSGRAHLRHWDPVETPLVAASLGLAVAMAVLGGLGLREEAGGSEAQPSDSA